MGTGVDEGGRLREAELNKKLWLLGIEDDAEAATAGGGMLGRGEFLGSFCGDPFTD